jgi:alanyl-tRNA synthetase
LLAKKSGNNPPPGRNMTERLYYRDSFIRDFEAEVTACVPATVRAPDKDRWHVLLDRTAFYPTSGGQPYDIGRLSNSRTAEVVDVFEDSNEEIVHVTDQPLSLGAVRGEIDWNRRFDHMQQHTAQHLLSAAFIELFKFHTTSFHLGREASTIDIAAPSIVPRYLAEAERRVNGIIFEDRPIHIRFADARQLEAEGIRKKVDREGILRVIDIEGFDRQPCGGSHLGRTGQAGMLLIRKCEKQKQNWRIEFAAGYRALAAARADRAFLLQSAEQIGCGPQEVPMIVGKFIEERRTGQRHAEELSEKLAALEAEELYRNAQSDSRSPDGPILVKQLVNGGDGNYLRLLGNKLIQHPHTIAALAIAAGNIAIARSADLPVDMGKLFREIASPFGGKGGGSSSSAQGSVPAADVEKALSLAVEKLKQLLASTS